MNDISWNEMWLIIGGMVGLSGLFIGYLLHRVGGILDDQNKRDDDESPPR